jgi:ABC-type lipoprotein export system ATPase subunit
VAGQRIDRLSQTRESRFRRQPVGMIFQFFNLLEDRVAREMTGMTRTG